MACTPRKIMLLAGENDLFQTAIEEIILDIGHASSDEDCWVDRGPSIFNQMPRSQKASSIRAVARALLTNTEPHFPLSAWSESTLAAILRIIGNLLAFEVDHGHGDSIRAVLASLTDSDITPSDAEWKSPQAWSYVSEAYEDQFLWDLDFENDDVVDLPPDAAKRVRDKMGIAAEYHTAIPPDLHSTDSLAECLEEIRYIFRND